MEFRKAMGAVIKESLTTAENNAESRFIDKACEWLHNALVGSIREWSQNGGTWTMVSRETFLEHFCKAMAKED